MLRCWAGDGRSGCCACCCVAVLGRRWAQWVLLAAAVLQVLLRVLLQVVLWMLLARRWARLSGSQAGAGALVKWMCMTPPQHARGPVVRCYWLLLGRRRVVWPLHRFLSAPESSTIIQLSGFEVWGGLAAHRSRPHALTIACHRTVYICTTTMEELSGAADTPAHAMTLLAPNLALSHPLRTPFSSHTHIHTHPRSTFMEELSDAADTLAHATDHSLVIMVRAAAAHPQPLPACQPRLTSL